MRRDLDAEQFAIFSSLDYVGWDIETTGLDWFKDRIRTCQLSCPTGLTVIVKTLDEPPPLLLSLLADTRVCKVFHHAPFDLRFLVGRWAAAPSNVACTKISSKLLHPAEADHSLKALLLRHLGVSINKKERMSDWSVETLSESQVRYASDDARFLIPLLRTLRAGLELCGRWDLASRCFAHLGARAELDVGGFGDVFAY
jgi:ribonuclease D